MFYPTETFCAILQVHNYIDIVSIPEGREWEICVNMLTRTIGFLKTQWLMHFNEHQKETIPQWFSGTHSTIYLKFLKAKMRNTHAPALHSWRSHLFAKISAATFRGSAFTHFPAGWRGCAVLHCLGWKLDPAGRAGLGEHRAPHSNTDAFIKSEKGFL